MLTLKNKTIIVTGGAGFIGSHLVDRLIEEEPEKIIVVDNLFLGKEENLEEAFKSNIVEFKDKVNATNFFALYSNYFCNEDKIDIVFNLAVMPLPHSLEEPFINIESNVNIINNLCQLQRVGLFKTLIHFSSSEVYGSNMYNQPMLEDHPYGVSTPYAASKAACDLIVQSYGKTFNLDYSIIRPFNNYGERQNLDKGHLAAIIPLTIQRILKGKDCIINGDGNQTRDYIYVKDTARAAIEIYKNEKTRNQIINIASGKETSVYNLVKKIIEVFPVEYQKTDKIKYNDPRPSDIKRHIANIFKAKDLINFSPSIDLEEGLKQTINWYIKHEGL